MMRALLVFFVALFAGSNAFAHESMPASLLITERNAGTIEVDWRIPATQGIALNIRPIFPSDCRVVETPHAIPAPSAQRIIWRMRCAQHLSRGVIRFDGLDATMVNVVVHLAYADGKTRSFVASPRNPYVELSAPSRLHSVDASGYFGLGIAHILTGYDHLLFVLCLILLVPNRWRLLKTVTAFTLAHSITLAMATLGYVHVPGPPIEANIALSIAFLAREWTRPEEARGLSARVPWATAFCFGLLHGLGFAGALAEVGLPQGEIPLALLLFNLGVETGQIAFIAAVLSGIALLKWFKPSWPAWSERAVAYSVGSISTFWLLQRLIIIAGAG